MQIIVSQKRLAYLPPDYDSESIWHGLSGELNIRNRSPISNSQLRRKWRLDIYTFPAAVIVVQCA
jgi:hypothetical protein